MTQYQFYIQMHSVFSSDCTVLDFVDLRRKEAGRLRVYRDGKNNCFQKPPADFIERPYREFADGGLHRQDKGSINFSYKTAAGAIRNERKRLRGEYEAMKLPLVRHADWSDIGYHFFIDRDGTNIEELPPGVYHGYYDGPLAHCDFAEVERAVLAQTNQRSNTMNTKEAITLMQLTNGATVVEARYVLGDISRTYHFKNVLGLELAEGDMIVAETRGEYALLRVVDPQVMPTKLNIGYDQLKHVVAKVDMAAHEAALDIENQAAHKMAMAEVHERLTKYREQLGDSFADVKGLITGVVNTNTAEASEAEGETD